MSKRIFISIFSTALIAVLATSAMFLYKDSNIKNDWLWLALIIILTAVFSLIAAAKIVRPIKEINLSQPNFHKSYKELAPLLEQLAHERHRT